MAITRATNLAGLGTVFDALTDGGGLSISGISTFTDLNVTRANVTGVTTATQLNVGTGGTVITTTNSGDVGIGTVLPVSGKLHVLDGNIRISGTSENVLKIRHDTAGSDSNISQTDNGSLRYRYGSTEVLRITSSGSIGIGTDNPTETLTLNHANGASIGLEYSGTENGTISVNSAAMYALAGSGKHLILGSDGAEKLRITSGGNVGIGTVPTTSIWGSNYQLLSIGTKTSGPILQLESTTANSNGKILGGITAANLASGVSTPESADIVFYQDGTDATQPGGSIRLFTRADAGSLGERVRLDSGGDFGIGDTNPLYKLSVVGTARINGSSIQGAGVAFGSSPITKTITITTSNVDAIMVCASAFTSGGSNSAAALFTVGGYIGGSTQYAAATTTYTTTGGSMSISNITKASGSFSFTMTLSASLNSQGYVIVQSGYPVTITVS